MSIFKAPFRGFSDQKLTDLFKKVGSGGIQQGSEDDQFSAADFTKAAMTKDYLHGLQAEQQTFGGDLVEDEDGDPTKMGFSVRSDQTGVGQEGWRDAVDQQKSSIKDFYGGLDSASGKHELGLGQTLTGKMGYTTFGEYVDQAAKAVQEGHGQQQAQQTDWESWKQELAGNDPIQDRIAGINNFINSGQTADIHDLGAFDINGDGYVTAADSLNLTNQYNSGQQYIGGASSLPGDMKVSSRRSFYILPDGTVRVNNHGGINARAGEYTLTLEELRVWEAALREQHGDSGQLASILQAAERYQAGPPAQTQQAQQAQGSYLDYLWGTEPYSGYDSQWGTTAAPAANVNDPNSVVIGPYENFEGSFQDFIQNQYPGLAATMIPTEMEQYFGGKYGSNVRELEFGQGALGYQAGTDPDLNRVLFATLPSSPEFENLMVGQVGNQIREYATHMANAFRSEEMLGVFNDQQKFGLTSANIQELQNLDPTQAGLSMTRRDADTLMTYIKSIESIYGQDYWGTRDAGQLMYDMSPRLTASYALQNPVQWNFLQLREGGDPNNMEDWTPRTLKTSVINIPLTDMQRSIMERVTANPQDLQVFIDWFKDIYGQGDPNVGAAQDPQVTSTNPFQSWSEWQHPEQQAELPAGVQQDLVGYQNPQDQQYYQGPSYYAPTSQVYSDAGWQAGLPQNFQSPDPLLAESQQQSAADLYGLTTQFSGGQAQVEDVIDQGQTDPIQDAITDQTDSGDQVFPDEVVEQIQSGQVDVDQVDIGESTTVDPVTDALTGGTSDQVDSGTQTGAQDQSGVVDQSPAGQDEQGEQAEVGTPDSNYASTTFTKAVITGGVNPDGTRNNDPFTYEQKELKAYQVATAANGTPVWVTEDGVIYGSNDDGTFYKGVSRKGMDKAFDESGQYIGPVIDPQTKRPYGEILMKSEYDMGVADGTHDNHFEPRRYELLGWWNGMEVRHAKGHIVYHDGQRWNKINRHRITDPNHWYIHAAAMGIQGYANWQSYEYKAQFDWQPLNKVYKRTGLHPNGPDGEWNLELAGMYRGTEIRRDQNTGKYYRNNSMSGWGAHSWWQEIDFNQAGNAQIKAILTGRQWFNVGGPYNFGPQDEADSWMIWQPAKNLRKNKQGEASTATGNSIDWYSDHARQNNYFGSANQGSAQGVAQGVAQNNSGVMSFAPTQGSSAESQIRNFAASSDQTGNQYRAPDIDYQDPWRDQGEGLGPITQAQLDWYESNQVTLGGGTPPGGHISAYDITADNWRHLPGKMRELAQGTIELMIDKYNDNVREFDRIAADNGLTWEQTYAIRDRLYKELVDTYRGGFKTWQNYTGGNQGMDTKIYGNPKAYDFSVHEPTDKMPEDWMAKIIKGQATASAEWIQQQIRADISAGEGMAAYIQQAINNETNPEKRQRLKAQLNQVKGTGAWYAKILKNHGINVGNLHDKVWRNAKMPMVKAKDAARMSDQQLGKRAVRNLFQYRINEAGIGMGSATALNHPHLLHDWDPGESFKVPIGLQVQSALGLYNDQSGGGGGWLESALSELGVNRNNVIMVSGGVKEGNRRINRVFSIKIGSQAHNMLRNGWTIQQIVDMTGGNPYTKYKGVDVSRKYYGG